MGDPAGILEVIQSAALAFSGSRRLLVEELHGDADHLEASLMQEGRHD
jgi:hypothetical protein